MAYVKLFAPSRSGLSRSLACFQRQASISNGGDPNPLPCRMEVMEAGCTAVGALREMAEMRTPPAAMASKPSTHRHCWRPPPLLLEATDPLHRPPAATQRKAVDPLSLGVLATAEGGLAATGVGPWWNGCGAASVWVVREGAPFVGGDAEESQNTSLIWITGWR
jgi:hypothetical protein